jgi:hypothetical protein
MIAGEPTRTDFSSFETYYSKHAWRRKSLAVGSVTDLNFFQRSKRRLDIGLEAHESFKTYPKGANRRY